MISHTCTHVNEKCLNRYQITMYTRRFKTSFMHVKRTPYYYHLLGCVIQCFLTSGHMKSGIICQHVPAFLLVYFQCVSQETFRFLIFTLFAEMQKYVNHVLLLSARKAMWSMPVVLTEWEKENDSQKYSDLHASVSSVQIIANHCDSSCVIYIYIKLRNHLLIYIYI